MAIDHTVVQGEYRSKIARNYGFRDNRTIWEPPRNAALEQARQNPNVLFPGDRLFIPDKEEKHESRVTDQNPMVVIRVRGVAHGEIPTVFIPILVRTAATV